MDENGDVSSLFIHTTPCRQRYRFVGRAKRTSVKRESFEAQTRVDDFIMSNLKNFFFFLQGNSNIKLPMSSHKDRRRFLTAGGDRDGACGPEQRTIPPRWSQRPPTRPVREKAGTVGMNVINGNCAVNSQPWKLFSYWPTPKYSQTDGDTTTAIQEIIPHCLCSLLWNIVLKLMAHFHFDLYWHIYIFIFPLCIKQRWKLYEYGYFILKGRQNEAADVALEENPK